MKLLITFDGSLASRAVFEPAARLARIMRAEVVLLRINDRMLEEELRGVSLNEIEGRWGTELRRIGVRMRCRADVQVHRLSGRRWRVDSDIIATAKELDADAIMMASQGQSRVRHLIVGSTALGVVARSDCPVVLVRSGADDAAVARKRRRPGGVRMLVAYDGSSTSRAVFEPAAQLAASTGGELDILRVYHPVQLRLAIEPNRRVREVGIIAADDAMAAELDAIGRGLPCPARSIVRRLAPDRSSVAEEILAEAEERRADIVCTATRGFSTLRHLILGSTALEVLGRSTLPVMLVRPRKGPPS